MGDVVDSGYLASNPLYGIGVTGPVAPERGPPSEGEENAGAREVENGGPNVTEGSGAEAAGSGPGAATETNAAKPATGAGAGVNEGLGSHVDVRV